MTRDQIIALAQEAGFDHIAEADYWHPLFERFAALVAAHEREECARLCEQTDDGTPYNLTAECAAAIRSRA